MRESPIFSRTYDLLRWIVPATVKFPRHQRFVLAEEIQHAAFRLHEHLLEASIGGRGARAIADADVALARLRVGIRLSRDLALFGDGQYAHAAALVDEVGRLLGGWKKSLVPSVGDRQ